MDMRSSIAPIPQELKLHPSVLKFFGDGNHRKSRDKLPSPQSNSFEGHLLEIEFGMGSRRGMDGIDMETAINEWMNEQVPV